MRGNCSAVVSIWSAAWLTGVNLSSYIENKIFTTKKKNLVFTCETRIYVITDNLSHAPRPERPSSLTYLLTVLKTNLIHAHATLKFHEYYVCSIYDSQLTREYYSKKSQINSVGCCEDPG